MDSAFGFSSQKTNNNGKSKLGRPQKEAAFKKAIEITTALASSGAIEQKHQSAMSPAKVLTDVLEETYKKILELYEQII
ncbi:MAG: hypothetical protein ACL93V_16745 [Candidatus Electrothrix sp. YB6]